MTPKRLVGAAILLAGSMLALASPGFAQPQGHGPMGHSGPPGGHPAFHGSAHFAFTHRDFGHFTPAEHGAWAGGHWHHGSHNGRLGWWWFASGAWYFYDTPIYPYPGYVSDYYVEDYGAPGQFWYYCPSPPGYYPYVQRCGAPWQPVPPTPPPGAGYGPSDADSGAPPPAGYQGQDGGTGSGDNPPPGYQGQGSNDQPPPGYQGQGPSDQPPPGYQGQGQGDQPPPGPGGQPPQQGYPPGPQDQSSPPPNGYNGPSGSN